MSDGRINPSVRQSERFGGYLIEYGRYVPDSDDDGRTMIVQFRVLKDAGNELDGRPFYERAENHGAPPSYDEFTNDPEDASTFLYGDVKWDGCSDWLFPENANNMMLHFCDETDPVTLGPLMERMFQIARRELGENCQWD